MSETELLYEQEVSFDTAVLAKGKGFDEYCYTHYCYGSGDLEKPKTGEVFVGGFLNQLGDQRRYKNSELVNWDLPYGEFSSPHQAFLQKWLRRVHKIDISVIWFDKGYIFSVKKQPFKANTYKVIFSSTYEESLELALVEALNLI